MPRAFVAGEQALLEGKAYNTHLQLFVEDPDGVFVDYTALGGSNWLLGFEHREAIDQAVGAITVDLWREDVTGSLAPLMGGSPYNRDALDNYAQALDAGREFYIRNAITALGATPTGGQWWEVIRGKIDTIPHGDRKSKITLIGRDLGGVLQDTIVQREMTFGVDGQSVEAAMQLVLDQWFPGVTLYVPTATGKTRGPLTVAKGRALLDVLREEALGIAHDVRYLPDEADSGTFKLTLYLPDRDKVTPDLTIGPSLYTNVSHLEISNKLVRTEFSIVFTDAATGQRVERTRTNAVALARYGPRWMGFEEREGSPIDTEAEADEYLSFADADTSTPIADQEIELPYYPHFQLNDLARWTANGVHYDSDQDWAVVGIRRRCYPKERKTFVATRGKPVASVLGWHRKALVAPVLDPTRHSLLDFKFFDGPTGRTYTWVNGAGIGEIWAATQTDTDPLPEGAFENLAALVTPRGLITELFIPNPVDNNRTIGRVEGRYTDEATGALELGDVWYIDVPGIAAPISYLEVTTETETGATGTFGVTVRDPGGLATSLEVQKKVGAAAWGAWELVTSTPADNTEYTEDVTPLEEGHLSFVKFRLNFTHLGLAKAFVIPSAGFDLGHIPRAWARIDRRDLTYYATIDGDSDCREEPGELSIIGHMSVLPLSSTPGEPPLTESSYLFSLTNSRHGTDPIGILVHGETPPTEIHVWVRGIAPGGALGPIAYFIQPSND